MVRSYAEILERVERGEAVVITAQEVAELVEAGEAVRSPRWTLSPRPHER